MSEKNRAERETRNRGLETEEERLSDPERRTSQDPDESDAAEPDRPTTPAEDSEGDIAHLENPPQAEGPRERSNDAV